MSRPADIRAHIRECIPEIAYVSDRAVREKILDVYQMALERSSWDRLEEVPHIFSDKKPRGDLLGHARAVIQICRESVRILKSFGHKLDEELILVGAILHDVGKIVEYGRKDGVAIQNKRLRHPMLGAHMALACGFPDDVVHIIMHHSVEGDIPLPPGHGAGSVANRRTMEAMVVSMCDHLAAQVRQREWRESDGTLPPPERGVPFSG